MFCARSRLGLFRCRVDVFQSASIVEPVAGMEQEQCEESNGEREEEGFAPSHLSFWPT